MKKSEHHPSRASDERVSDSVRGEALEPQLVQEAFFITLLDALRHTVLGQAAPARIDTFMGQIEANTHPPVVSLAL
jgi:hypothetical protein